MVAPLQQGTDPGEGLPAFDAVAANAGAAPPPASTGATAATATNVFLKIGMIYPPSLPGVHVCQHAKQLHWVGISLELADHLVSAKV
jgi:hypothetical protein